MNYSVNWRLKMKGVKLGEKLFEIACVIFCLELTSFHFLSISRAFFFNSEAFFSSVSTNRISSI